MPEYIILKGVLLMSRYVIKRVLLLIPIFFIVSVFLFLLIQIAPGDPVTSITGGARTSPEVIANIKAKYHLDEPLYLQYWYWLRGVLQGDFGDSYKFNQSVISLVGERIGVTFQMVGMSMVIGILLSIPLGILAAVKKNTVFDYIASFLSVMTMSSPVFFTGLLLMLLLSFKLNLFPSFGAGKTFAENLRYLFIPSLAMGLNMVAMNMRILKSSMLEALSSNYVQTAIAKGLSRKKIIFIHALKNSIIPYITMSGIEIGTLIGYGAVIEQMFGIGGLGSLLIKGVLTSDFPVIQGATLFIVMFFLIINLVVDVLCAAIDPRIQLR